MGLVTIIFVYIIIYIWALSILLTLRPQHNTQLNVKVDRGTNKKNNLACLGVAPEARSLDSSGMDFSLASHISRLAL